MPMRLLGAQIASPTTTGAASTVSSARVVLVQNVGTTSRLVTLEQTDGTDIGTFNVPPNANIQIEKATTDQIFAANAEVKLTPIAFHY
jgi:hypothetical protein